MYSMMKERMFIRIYVMHVLAKRTFWKENEDLIKNNRATRSRHATSPTRTIVWCHGAWAFIQLAVFVIARNRILLPNKL